MQKGYAGSLLWSAASLDSSYGCHKTRRPLASVLLAASSTATLQRQSAERSALRSTQRVSVALSQPSTPPAAVRGIGQL